MIYDHLCCAFSASANPQTDIKHKDLTRKETNDKRIQYIPLIHTVFSIAFFTT